MQVVVPSVSRAAVLQGTALAVFAETPSGATLSKPGPVPTGKAFGCEAGAQRVLAQMHQYHLWMRQSAPTQSNLKPPMLPPSNDSLLA
jgi:hypothetical protein